MSKHKQTTSLFKRDEHYSLFYKLKNDTKVYSITLKSNVPIKSMEEAEELAKGHLLPFGKKVVSYNIRYFKASGYILRYLDINGNLKQKSLTHKDSNGKTVPVFEKRTAQQLADAFLKDINKIKDIQSQNELLFRIGENKKLIAALQLKITNVWKHFLNSPRRRDTSKKTIDGYLSIWNLFLEFLKSNYPNIDGVYEITEHIGDEYFMQLWNSGVSEGTYNAHYQALTHILKIVLKDDFYTHNPFRNIMKKKNVAQPHEPFTNEQLVKIFELLKDDSSFYLLNKSEMKTMLSIMVYTGCRGQDACTLQWSDIIENSPSDWIFYITPKKTERTSGKSVSVPIHDELRKELLKHRTKETVRDDYVLKNVAERYLKNPYGIGKDVIRLIEASGLNPRVESKNGVRRHKKRVTVYAMHSFRFTFATIAAENGIPIEVVRDMIGHTSDAMTRHYMRISDQRKIQAIQSIPSFLPSEP